MPSGSAQGSDQAQGGSSGSSSSKKPKTDPNSIRLGVKVSKLSDTSDDDDEDGDGKGSGGGGVKGASHSGAGGATKKSHNGDGNERLSDSSSSCSSSNDSSSSSDSCSDDDSSDDSDDSSSLSSNSSLSSSYEPDAGAKPSGSGTSGKGGGEKFSSKKGSVPFDAALSMQKKGAGSNANGSSHSRSTFSFTDFSAKTTEADGGVWGFAAEAKKSAEIFATPPTTTSSNDRIFGEFKEEDEEGETTPAPSASGSKTPMTSSRGRKTVQREVMKETRNTFNRDFASPDSTNSSGVKRRVARAQSDSNNNTNASAKKAVATEPKRKEDRRDSLAVTKAETVAPVTPKSTKTIARAALNQSAANDNFVTPSGSGSRATPATSSSPPPYNSINGQDSMGKDAIPYIIIHQRTRTCPL